MGCGAGHLGVHPDGSSGLVAGRANAMGVMAADSDSDALVDALETGAKCSMDRASVINNRLAQSRKNAADVVSAGFRIPPAIASDMPTLSALRWPRMVGLVALSVPSLALGAIGAMCGGMRTTLAPLLCLAFACGGSQGGTSHADPMAGANPDSNRSVDSSGGHATFGVRVYTDAEHHRVRVVGVMVDVDAEEHVYDLGEWEGEMTEGELRGAEFGHLNFDGVEHHELTFVPAGPTDVDVFLDGALLRRIHAEAPVVEPAAPLLLTPPTMEVNLHE